MYEVTNTRSMVMTLISGWPATFHLCVEWTSNSTRSLCLPGWARSMPSTS